MLDQIKFLKIFQKGFENVFPPYFSKLRYTIAFGLNKMPTPFQALLAPALLLVKCKIF